MGMMTKKFKNDNVYDATLKRLDEIFTHFEKVYVSFSGGKDSGVLLQLALQKAREHNRLPLHVLFVDLEGQYKHTIEFIEEMMSLPDVIGHWICLPIQLRNAVSQNSPLWMCWDPLKKDAWIREMPHHPSVISDPRYFDFFQHGMSFEKFVLGYADWFSRQTFEGRFSPDNKKTACLVGIRADESLNRFRTIKNNRKEMFNGHKWSTKINQDVYNFYPIYDWKFEDIWIANSKFNFKYNSIYNLMYLAGVPLGSMRICQPYGDDQRKGLYLFKMLEPDTWSKVVARVEGANFGNRYAGDRALGNRRVILPPGHTYKSYSKFLLSSMPPPLATHYKARIFKFLNWWRKHAKETGYTFIPDEADPKLETAKKAPSWRRVCKVILRNDYWCTGLSFGPTKKDYERQLDIILNLTTHKNPMEL